MIFSTWLKTNIDFETLRLIVWTYRLRGDTRLPGLFDKRKKERKEKEKWMWFSFTKMKLFWNVFFVKVLSCDMSGGGWVIVIDVKCDHFLRWLPKMIYIPKMEWNFAKWFDGLTLAHCFLSAAICSSAVSRLAEAYGPPISINIIDIGIAILDGDGLENCGLWTTKIH